MKKSLCSVALICLIIGLCVSDAKPESYVGKLRTIEFAHNDLLEIVGQPEENPDPDAISIYLFRNSVSRLLQAAKSKEISLQITKSTLYLSDQKVRFDAETRGGRISQLMLLDEGKIYNIIWPRKQYVEMSIEEMKQRQAKAQEAVENLRGMESMLDKLPPEARAQLRAQIDRANAGGPIRVRKTGRKQPINGFNCEEYRVESNSGKRQVWVSRRYPAFVKVFGTVLTQLPSPDPSASDSRESEIWKQIPKAWPVVMKNFEFSPSTKEVSFEIQETESMEEQSVPESTFNIPAGFTKISAPSSMQGMPPGRE